MSKHLKRLNAPRALKLHRKERKWTVKSNAGPHPLKTAIPVGLIIRDYLNLTDTMREAKRILSNEGHLSNVHASTLIKEKGKELKWALLAHLSANNNTPEKAEESFETIVKNKVAYSVLSRDKESGSWKL